MKIWNHNTKQWDSHNTDPIEMNFLVGPSTGRLVDTSFVYNKPNRTIYKQPNYLAITRSVSESSLNTSEDISCKKLSESTTD